jgi:pyocin large subunit-like protein
MNLRLGGWPTRRLFTAALAAIAILAYWSHVGGRGERAVARESGPASETAAPGAPSKGWGARVGFETARRLEEHYEKHGGEFGRISKQDYLRQAQLLRDAAVGGPVLETVRADRVATRYDQQTGAFIAFNPDGTIRTFFKPNDGERYYRRQAERVGE